MATEEELLNRLKELKSLHSNVDTIKPLLEKQGNLVAVKGTGIEFNDDDIMKLEALFQDTDAAAKIAQSDVPNNMLALLTALRAAAR